MRDDLPAVEHATHRCACLKCTYARQAEAELRRRIELARREDMAGREAALLEAMARSMGDGREPAIVVRPRKAMPGTATAITRRYGR